MTRDYYQLPFMGANCSPQSELRMSLLGLAQDYSVATRCLIHYTMCVALGISAMLI